MQSKLEQERREKQAVEARLLEAEKTKNEMGVDLVQLQQQCASLQTQIKAEADKVSTTGYGSHDGHGASRPGNILNVGSSQAVGTLVGTWIKGNRKLNKNS